MPRQNGDALSIYHKFDVMRGKVKYTACFPVTAIPEKLPEGFISGRVPDLTTYSIRHTGPYHHIANAWGQYAPKSKQFKPATKASRPLKLCAAQKYPAQCIDLGYSFFNEGINPLAQLPVVRQFETRD